MSESPLALPERLQIQDVAEWKEHLVAYLENHPSPVLDGSEVAAIDTAGLQLLVALVREVAQQGGTVRWASLSTELIESARILGVTDHLNIELV